MGELEPFKVKRYEFWLGGGKTEEPDGGYVEWEDYQKLLALYRKYRATEQMTIEEVHGWITV
jgi:hypothetical protein